MEIVLLLALLVLAVVGLLRANRTDTPHTLREKPTEPKATGPRPKPFDAQRAMPSPFDARSAKPQPAKPVVQGRAYVIDGDSLIIQKTQIRLFGVDAPEMNHPYGKKAKWALAGLCKGETIRAEVTEMDDYGRAVARCYLSDGRDLSAEMVKLGLAIDWAKFSGGQYRALEMPDARRKLWLAEARQTGRMYLWEHYEDAASRRKRIN